MRQWGVRHPGGRVEKIDAASANEGYMTEEQYAQRRAEVTKGTVVTRTSEVRETPWAEADSPSEGRSYVIALPVVITVHPDGRVTAEVDLCEASAAPSEDDKAAGRWESLDTALIDAAVEVGTVTVTAAS